MDAWVPVAATVAGAAIAILGQHIARRGDVRKRTAELLLEQCALLVALNEEFRNLVWEERVLGREGRVESWDLSSARLAAARLRILCRDNAVLDALNEMSAAGKKLGAYWRQGEIEAGELEDRYIRLKDATESFVQTSGGFVRQRLDADRRS